MQHQRSLPRQIVYGRLIRRAAAGRYRASCGRRRLSMERRVTSSCTQSNLALSRRANATSSVTAWRSMYFHSTVSSRPAKQPVLPHLDCRSGVACRLTTSGFLRVSS